MRILLYVEQDCFKGPFELLLSLLEEGKLSVLEVSIAKIVSSYLDRLREGFSSFEESCLFLERVLELFFKKLEVLLRSEVEEGEDEGSAGISSIPDGDEEVVLPPSPFGALARALAARLARYGAQFRRLPKGEENLALEELDAWELARVYFELVRSREEAERRERKAAESLSALFSPLKPIEHYVERVLEVLSSRGRCTVAEVLSSMGGSKRHAVALFLALLELLRLGRCECRGADLAAEVLLADGV